MRSGQSHECSLHAIIFFDCSFLLWCRGHAPAGRRWCSNKRLLGAWPRAHNEAQDAALLNSRARTKPELVLLLIENDNDNDNDNDIHAIALVMQ